MTAHPHTASPILAELDRALERRALHGLPGGTSDRLLARGEGWSVADVVCTSGPGDRPFEERHERVGLAVVVAGSFGYRSAGGGALMTPGSLLLGDSGGSFECGHEHGRGDRCVAFQFEPELFDRVAADAGARRSQRRLGRPRLPPSRALAPLVARACAGLLDRDGGGGAAPWEELAWELAGRAVELAAGLPPDRGRPPRGAEARIAAAVRRIEREPADDHRLGGLARAAGLSPYHFLRTFERAVGVTPHQFVLRCRLRAAAERLAAGCGNVLDVALDSGYGDLSNFHRSFRVELGVTPGAFRTGSAAARARPGRSQREAGGTTPASRA